MGCSQTGGGVCLSPGFPEPYLIHPDHLTTGRTVLNLARSEVGRGTSVYFYGTRDTKVIVNITPVIHDKIRAVLAHKSRMRAPVLVYDLLVRLYARLRGRPAQISYAEGFRALSLPRLSPQALGGEWTTDNHPVH